MGSIVYSLTQIRPPAKQSGSVVSTTTLVTVISFVDFRGLPLRASRLGGFAASREFVVSRRPTFVGGGISAVASTSLVVISFPDLQFTVHNLRFTVLRSQPRITRIEANAALIDRVDLLSPYHQNVFGNPACFRTASAVGLDFIALSTTNRTFVIGLYQIS